MATAKVLAIHAKFSVETSKSLKPLSIKGCRCFYSQSCAPIYIVYIVYIFLKEIDRCRHIEYRLYKAFSHCVYNVYMWNISGKLAAPI